MHSFSVANGIELARRFDCLSVTLQASGGGAQEFAHGLIWCDLSEWVDPLTNELGDPIYASVTWRQAPAWAEGLGQAI